MPRRKMPRAGATRWTRYPQASDHGELQGLADDDHSQYLLANGSRSATSLTVTNDLSVGNDASVANDLSVTNGVSVGATLEISDGAGHYLKVPSLTTTERDNLTPTAGMIIFNSTTTAFEGYNGTSWVTLG